MTEAGCRRRERRALAAGCEIVDVDGLTIPLVFACVGEPPRIYLPAAWTGPFRDYAVLAMVDVLVTRGTPEDERVELWADLIERVVGPLDRSSRWMRTVA
jgi:hypothetical protein